MQSKTQSAHENTQFYCAMDLDRVPSSKAFQSRDDGSSHSKRLRRLF